MSYLEFAREAKANKKFKTVLTSAIRLHCTKPELWLYAAKWTLETEADMNGARGYMQRATRFCTKSKEIWIEYARLEMIYLAKINLRRKILGLDRPKTDAFADEPVDEFSLSADTIAIPAANAYAMQASMMDTVKVDGEAVKDPFMTPALQGAIPIAIFEDARKQFFYKAGVAEEFFDMFATFTQVSCQQKILDHVLDSTLEAFPTDASTYSCYIRRPILNINPQTAEFPAALASALERLKAAMEKTSDKGELSKKTIAWIEPMLAIEDLDPGLSKVLHFTQKKLV